MAFFVVFVAISTLFVGFAVPYDNSEFFDINRLRIVEDNRMQLEACEVWTGYEPINSDGKEPITKKVIYLFVWNDTIALDNALCVEVWDKIEFYEVVFYPMDWQMSYAVYLDGSLWISFSSEGVVYSKIER